MPDDTDTSSLLGDTSQAPPGETAVDPDAAPADNPAVNSDVAEAGAVAPPSALAAPVEPVGVELAVTRWFNTHIANSPVSQRVECINHVTSVLPALVAEIKKG